MTRWRRFTPSSPRRRPIAPFLPPLGRLLESAVDDADTEAKRAATMKQAVQLSGKTQTAARRIDALAAEFRSIVHELPVLEHQIWRALRAAGQTPNGGRVGKKNIDGFAMGVILGAHKGMAFRPRPLADLAASWGYLDQEPEND